MTKKWIYKIDNTDNYQIGYVSEDDDPDTWWINVPCDDELGIKNMVKELNEFERKRRCKKCGHQNEEICNTCLN
jgi:hypothetical protein